MKKHFEIFATLVTAALLACGCDAFLSRNDGTDEWGEAVSSAFSVREAGEHIGEKDVWVTGYVVGGDLTSSKVKFEPPFSSRTCLAIAADPLCTERDSCISVQLPSGTLRDSLNLVDNPAVLGKRVYLKGDLDPSYYGLTGLKSPSRYYAGND